MGKSVYLSVVVVALASCAAPVVTRSDVPAAVSAAELGNDQCDARRRAAEFQTASQYLGCLVDVNRKFVADIRLTQVEIFKSYAGRVAILGQQLDSGTIPLPELWPRHAVLVKDMLDQITAAQRLDDERRARISALVTSLGQGGPSPQVQAPAIPPNPLSTTTTILPNGQLRTCQNITNGPFTQSQCF